VFLDEVSAAWTLPKSLHGWIYGVFIKEYLFPDTDLNFYKSVKSSGAIMPQNQGI